MKLVGEIGLAVAVCFLLWKALCGGLIDWWFQIK